MLEAVIFDFGDTLALEESEKKNANQVTERAELFPGVTQALQFIAGQDIQIALLADCLPGTGRASYDNVLKQHSIEHLFAAIVCSDDVGENKPSPRMFEEILQKLGLEDSSSVAMVGNRLDRDIVGAKRLGFITVYAKLTDNYRQEPWGEEEVADYSFTNYKEFIPVLEEILSKD